MRSIGATAEQVIVVGAGPVGLAAALELARFGIRSTLIEKHPGTSWHPKTRNLNTRTMEIARGWGGAVYKRLRSIDTPDGWKSPIRFLDKAVGRELGRIETLGFVGPGPEISPAEPVMSSQELIETILLDAVRATGLVDIRFGTEMTRLLAGSDPSDRHATIEIRDGAGSSVAQIEGAALVAADGAASVVRDALGMPMEGPRELTHVINCYFRADIERYLRDRPGVLYFVANDKARGVLQPLDAAGRWLCQINVKPEEWSLNFFDKQRASDWIRAAAGIDGLEVEVLSLGKWQMNATVVERLVQGRIVLCGDAAHQFPPTGGLGVNTGLQGMHNAMWKLAWCVGGLAGWPLLETYHAERREISKQIAMQSLQNSKNVGRIFHAAAGRNDSGLSAAEVAMASRRYGNHLGIEFGACYASPAVVSDGTQPAPVEDSYTDYVQSATPGARAPHVWLGRPDARLSTLDLIGTGFTLLAGPKAGAWVELAEHAARQFGIAVNSYAIGSPGLQDAGRFVATYGIGADGAVLIRPDGHVGWRARSGPVTERELEAALRQILAR